MLKFKDLTDDNKKLLESVYKDKSISWDERINTVITRLGVSERSVRRWWVKLGLKERVEPQGEQITMAENKDFDKTKNVFLISCAQNATPVNKNFVHNMEAYANHINGEILVIPIRYRNPTTIDGEKKEDDWWDEKIIPYLSLKRHQLNKNVTVLSDVKTQPTDSMPLNGFEALANQGTLILAHPRVHMKSLPTLDDSPKMMFTTGCCTKDNYINSKRGKIGEFHHTYGFVVVEIEDDETYYIRQVTATDNGNFNDLYFNVQNGEVKRNSSVAALIKGDIHYGEHDQQVLDVSFNKLVPKLTPGYVVLHDVFDGKSVNHHDENNFIIQYQKEQNNENSLQNEIDNLLEWVNTIKQHNLVVVFSNHDDFLNRYIINKDFKKDIKNAKEYLKYAQILLEDKAPNGLIAYCINEKFPQVKCLGRDDNFKVLGWELAVHGMDGVGGTRGSIAQYKKLNTHIITGHAHNPCRMDGAVQVGTNSKLRLGYNHGMSSWVHSDAIIHYDKKVQQIFYIGKNKEFSILK